MRANENMAGLRQELRAMQKMQQVQTKRLQAKKPKIPDSPSNAVSGVE